MRLGYNTNGLAHHRLTDAIELLADEGYQSVAITLDAGALDPYEEPEFLARQVSAVRAALDRRGLARVVETGARFLLNPRLKHDPTLMDPDPARREVRIDFLRRAIDLAVSHRRRGRLALVGATRRPDRRRPGHGAAASPPCVPSSTTPSRQECRWPSSPSPGCSSTRSIASIGSTSGSAIPCST